MRYADHSFPDAGMVVGAQKFALSLYAQQNVQLSMEKYLTRLFAREHSFSANLQAI
jgi:hypothetical protein